MVLHCPTITKFVRVLAPVEQGKESSSVRHCWVWDLPPRGVSPGQGRVLRPCSSTLGPLGRSYRQPSWICPAQVRRNKASETCLRVHLDLSLLSFVSFAVCVLAHLKSFAACMLFCISGTGARWRSCFASQGFSVRRVPFSLLATCQR